MWIPVFRKWQESQVSPSIPPVFAFQPHRSSRASCKRQSVYAERSSCRSGEVDADPGDNMRENGIQNQGVLCVSFDFGVSTKRFHEQHYGYLTTRMIKPHHIAGKSHCPSAQEYAVEVLILTVLYCLPNARSPPTLCVLCQENFGTKIISSCFDKGRFSQLNKI